MWCDSKIIPKLNQRYLFNAELRCCFNFNKLYKIWHKLLDTGKIEVFFGYKIDEHENYNSFLNLEKVFNYVSDVIIYFINKNYYFDPNFNKRESVGVHNKTKNE